MCNGMVIGPLRPARNSHWAHKFLYALKLLNGWNNSPYLKVCVTVLAHRCATTGSLAHRALLKIPIRHPNSWECCNSTTTGLSCTISSSMEPSWHVDVQQHGNCPSRPSRNSRQAPKFLWMLELHYFRTESHHLMFYGTVMASKCATAWSWAL